MLWEVLILSWAAAAVEWPFDLANQRILVPWPQWLGEGWAYLSRLNYTNAEPTGLSQRHLGAFAWAGENWRSFPGACTQKDVIQGSHSKERCWDVEANPDDCVSAPEFSCAWNQRPTADKSEVPGFLSVHATIPVHTFWENFFFLLFWRIRLSPYPPFPVWVSQANNPIRCSKKEYFHGQMDLIDCVEQISPLGDPQCTLAH